MQLTSTAFQTNTPLPIDYTCKGKGVNPPLTISGVPEGTRSLALIMHDPDAVGGRDFLHWAVWNIDPNTKDLPEGILPMDAVQGTNDYPSVGYGPACPPAGTGLHHYTFELYALTVSPNLQGGASRNELERFISGNTIDTAQLIGTVQS